MSSVHDVNVYGARLFAPIISYRRSCRLRGVEYEKLRQQVQKSEAKPHIFPGVPLELSWQHNCLFMVDQDHHICLRISTEPSLVTWMRITKISDLPGIDRVLRPTHSQELSDMQRNLYMEFTMFLMSVDVKIVGPFSCATSLKAVDDNDYFCQLVGDRPIPIFVECVPMHIRISKVLDFELPGRVENLMYHVTQDGRSTFGDIPPHIPIIYVG